MVDHTVFELRGNGAGLQAYLKKTFVRDSAFPSHLSEGTEVVAHPTPGGGLLLLPTDRLDEYPISIDEPPAGFLEEHIEPEADLPDVDAQPADSDAEEASD